VTRKKKRLSSCVASDTNVKKGEKATHNATVTRLKYDDYAEQVKRSRDVGVKHEDKSHSMLQCE